jgi:hypothetical protein
MGRLFLWTAIVAFASVAIYVLVSSSPTVLISSEPFLTWPTPTPPIQSYFAEGDLDVMNERVHPQQPEQRA